MTKPAKPTSIAVAPIPAVVRERDLEALLGVDRMTVRKWERRGDFPPRLNLSANTVGWLGSDIAAWLASRPRGICGSVTAQESQSPESRGISHVPTHG